MRKEDACHIGKAGARCGRAEARRHVQFPRLGRGGRFCANKYIGVLNAIALKHCSKKERISDATSIRYSDIYVRR